MSITNNPNYNTMKDQGIHHVDQISFMNYHQTQSPNEREGERERLTENHKLLIHQIYI